MRLDISLQSGDRGGRGQPDGIAVALLGFATALTVFLLFPPFLRGQVGSVPGFTGQEAADLLTPIIAMPLLALAVELTGEATTRTRVLLIALVALWVSGQGIHLAANAIGDVFPAGPERAAFYATSAGALDHALDEVLSHWMWHLAWVGLLGTLLLAGVTGARTTTMASRRSKWVAGLAGVLHGFTWFVVTDEGGTWALAIPATILLLVLALLLRSRDGAGRVITSFLIVGSLLTLALYGTWIAYAGWPPASLIERLGL